MTADAFAIGVDVGGTNIRAARILASGAIAQKQVRATSREPHAALASIIRLIAEMGGSAAAAIGIGVPGRVDGRTGDVISGGYLDLSQVALKVAVAREFGRPVTVLNDCSMALVAEAKVGAGKGMGNLVMLTIGTGIGGAAMSGGQLINGRRSAGQLGHVVVKADGLPCLCGQRGCVETESSGTSLRRHLREAGFDDAMMFEDIVPLAEVGDTRATGAIRAWAEPLRAAIWTLSAAFDPDAVIIGGGMGKAAMAALAHLLPLTGWYEVKVCGADLGDDAGVIGAGLAALDEAASNRAKGRRLVMVNGVPASGKSSVARAISSATGWPLLGLDTVKNPFLDVIEGVDRPFNRTLGRASYKAMFSIIADGPADATYVMDAWFGFQPNDVLIEHLAMAGITHIAEFWCHAPPEVIGQRYGDRAGERASGHPGLAYVPELIELARRAAPIGFGPVQAVDTTTAHDVPAMLDWVRTALDVAPEIPETPGKAKVSARKN